MASDHPNLDLKDYRDTVFLPVTDFPMRAGLPVSEPIMLKKWRELDIYHRVRHLRQAEEALTFVLHDGPPYANGDIHIGHALNKILKDFVVRSQFLLGNDVDYVPGWDCHGLPIEWKIEEEFLKKNRKKGEIPAEEFRQACRAYAAHWIAIQKEQFERLGIVGDFANRYATMDYDSEACVVNEIHKFLMSGQLYRGSKPVMWSPVERTALADAEVEYHPHTSPTIWVKFPVMAALNPTDAPSPLIGANIVIWTTTPWTIPANRALAYNPSISYGLYEIDQIKTAEELGFAPWVKQGERLILADKLAQSVLNAANVTHATRISDVNPAAVAYCSHPLSALDKGYGFGVPMLSGTHVTDDAGTGFVHTAPGHGVEDYQVWLAHGHSLADIPQTVNEDGAYYDDVPLFGGLKIMETEGKKAGKFSDANKIVMEKLIEAGTLLARGRLDHSYPHSWRSKAPIIYRNTPQWFIRMGEKGGLRDKALNAIDKTQFFPESGKNRIRSMVESRPDWLISRQRNWGTPLALYVSKKDGKVLMNDKVNRRIVDAIKEGGADAWFIRPCTDFLGTDYSPDDFEKITDILDVWFDSGTTHVFALNKDDKDYPVADLYLEGSDQHRGWFQSSLLESCGTRGVAPYRAVLTHGFVLDEQGEKMSKSKGNVVSPLDMAKEHGVEILRLWVALSDYREDLRIGKQIIQTTVDSYRKIRNSLRYLLGGLNSFSDDEKLNYDDMPALERYILACVSDLDQKVRRAYSTYDFASVIRPVSDFAAQTLSALYFDIRKDSLYCDRPDSLRRRANRTVMHYVLEKLLQWLGPILSFTCEEAYAYHYEHGLNIDHPITDVPQEWHRPDEIARFEKITQVLSVVTAALEEKRRDKTIGSALEAAPDVYLNDASLLEAFDTIDPSEVFRTSQAQLILGEPPEAAFRLNMLDGVGVVFKRAQGQKCQRSWRILPEVGTHPKYPDLSLRDADFMEWYEAQKSGENA